MTTQKPHWKMTPEERKEAKKARQRELRARRKERLAHEQACREYAAKQTGPFFCIVCKNNEVAKFDMICSCCDKAGKEEIAAWSEDKLRIVGTF